MENYSATVTESFLELTKREKIKFKTAQEKISLSDETKKGAVILSPKNLVVVEIHNPHTKERQEDGSTKRVEKDYKEYLIETQDGLMYSTSSDSLYSSLYDIMSDMLNEDGTLEDFEVKVIEKPSSNFAGNFLTCQLIFNREKGEIE